MDIEKHGFTAMEVFVIMIVLGVIASVVVPKFSEASSQAKLKYMVSDLHNMRSQIELYKIQHFNELPGTGAHMDFVTAMTSFSQSDGMPSVAGAPKAFGRYLQKVPVNPFTMTNTIEVSSMEPEMGASAWFFNTETGEFRANDSKAHAAY